MPIGFAQYVGPTDTYDHGVLGDAIEADHVVTYLPAEGFCDTISAGPGRVFEDTTPRIADVTSDGQDELILVATDVQRGARLEVWGYISRGVGPEHDIQMIAATPYIGQRYRWLAPAAIGDLDGDGTVEIAYVDRPHLAKVLRIWRYAKGDFREVANAGGVTNHAIGDEVIHGGLRDCGQGSEIILSNADRTRMLAVTYDGDSVAARDLGRWSAVRAKSALACRR